jgi:hypothetical protein
VEEQTDAEPLAATQQSEPVEMQVIEDPSPDELAALAALLDALDPDKIGADSSSSVGTVASQEANAAIQEEVTEDSDEDVLDPDLMMSWPMDGLESPRAAADVPMDV